MLRTTLLSMRDEEKIPGKDTPETVVEKRPWEPPRLVPLDVASTEAADFPDGFDIDGGPPVVSGG
jgi:hypothetical protein